MSYKNILIVCLVLLGLAMTVVAVDAQGPRPGGGRAPSDGAGTGFTYQGQLKSGGALVNGSCDFQFGLWDALSGGAQVGATQTIASVVTNGLFTVQLNAGGQITTGTAFNGDARYLAIAVSCPTGSGINTALDPRQALTAAPYAQYALNASTVLGYNRVNYGGYITTTEKVLGTITVTTGTSVFYEYSVYYEMTACSQASVLYVYVYVDGSWVDFAAPGVAGSVTGCAGVTSIVSNFGLLSVTPTTHVFQLRASSNITSSSISVPNGRLVVIRQ